MAAAPHVDAPALPPPHRLLRPSELAAKVRQYEAFANDVLKADLQRTVEARARLAAELEELEQLDRSLAQLREVWRRAAWGAWCVRSCLHTRAPGPCSTVLLLLLLPAGGRPAPELGRRPRQRRAVPRGGA